MSKQRRSNRIKNPSLGGDKKGLGDLGINFNDALSLGLPLASFFENRKNARERVDSGVDVDFDQVDLTTPAVRSARRPLFTTSSRNPQGSSLAERESGLRFAEAQTDAREQQFEAFNDEFIQKQIRNNVGIKNQGEMINAQVANQENQINTQTKLNRIEAASNQANASLEAVFQNAISLGNQNTMSKAAINASVLEALITSGMTEGAAQKLVNSMKGRGFSKAKNKVETDFNID